MRAIRFKAFGDPSVLELADVGRPGQRRDQPWYGCTAASINPSDVKNVAGAMKQTTLPRIPGRDYRGRGRGGSERMDRRRGMGNRRRYRLHPRRHPCRADRRAGREPAPKAGDASTSIRRRSVGVNYMAAWCGLRGGGPEGAAKRCC